MIITPAILALAATGQAPVAPPETVAGPQPTVVESPFVAGGAAERSERTQIGATIARFEAIDVRYLPRTLDELGERTATVIIFTTVDCPITQRYLPRVVEMERRLRPRGVRFVAINAGPADTILEMATQAVDHGAGFPFLKDMDGSAVQSLGVTRVPEVCVVDPEGVLRYRGRVDDQIRFGGQRPEVSRHDLAEAIEDVLGGKDVRVSETPVDGCRITPPDSGTGTSAVDAASKPSPTWQGAVSEIAQRHCQECHGMGDVAPFPLLTSRDFKDHSSMIREVVLQRRMPPAFASPKYGSFTNTRGLASDELATLIAWLDAGCPEGTAPATSPGTAEVEAGSTWRIGTPDLILRAPMTAKLPADGYVPYKYTVIPHVFMEDTWVQAIEIKPRNRPVLHHANLLYIEAKKIAGGEGIKQGNFLTGQVPGGGPMVLDPDLAVLIPAGSLLALQMHYVTTGQEETDRISVGLRFPRQTVRRQLHHIQVTNRRFEIPPHAPAHEVKASKRLPRDAIGLGMFSHMHLRGSDMRFTARRPGEDPETLLLIPNYSFDWQMSYRWEPGTARFPKGTIIECVAHFDNSEFNPFNPDPDATVKFGLQTYHEMMYGFFFYTTEGEDLNLSVDPSSGHAAP